MKKIKKSSLEPLVTKPQHQSREKHAAFVKERIYGSVTLIAVNIGLLFKAGLTTDSAFITIISTAIGIWLASMFAAVMSYRLVHDKNMPKAEFIHELTIHRGLLVAAIPSLIMLTLAALEIIALRTAIIADISLAFIAMTVTIVQSAKTKSNSLITAGVSILIQAAVAGVIILVKLGEK